MVDNAFEVMTKRQMRRWTWIRTPLRWLAACLALTVLSGCISSSGPIAIEDNTHFPGLYNIVEKLPVNGSLNIFVTHGINATDDDSEVNLRNSIQQRLGLIQIGQTVQKSLKIPMPDITLDGMSIWPAAPGYTWECPDDGTPLQNCEAPYIDISTYQTKDGKDVVFYSLNYWGVLVWLKCSQMVPADTKLTGDLTSFGTGNAAYCNGRFNRPGFPIPTNAVSTSPLIIDHVIKNDIMSWGFGDAVIAISGYRQVLHQAVRAALDAESVDVGARMRFREEHRPRPSIKQESGEQGSGDSGTFKDAFEHPKDTNSQAYAIITESLGSYVVLDTLAWATTQDLLPSEGESILCRASQIHMLANQVSLLRLSRIRAHISSGASAETDRPGQGSAPSAPVNCPGSPSPPYVIGYHDPSDLLTFYLPHPAPGAHYSFEAQLDTRMINVVAPFAQEVIPFLLANPTEAHVAGQEIDPRIENMVSFGSDGHEPNQAPASAPGPAPRAASR